RAHGARASRPPPRTRADTPPPHTKKKRNLPPPTPRKTKAPPAPFSPEDEAQAVVLKYVTFDPIHIDEIIRNSSLASSTVSGALTMMELRGLIRQVGGMNYVRLRETSEKYQTA
ncbi:MAG: hypothetical protein OXC95_09195, partial [Dehalococcoidia bacterium]|nr:hypothetical protein [Dehalococcoidia bacterium]